MWGPAGFGDQRTELVERLQRNGAEDVALLLQARWVSEGRLWEIWI